MIEFDNEAKLMENDRIKILNQIRSGELSPEDGDQQLQNIYVDAENRYLNQLRESMKDVLTEEGLANLKLFSNKNEFISYLSENLSTQYVNSFAQFEYSDRLKLAEFVIFGITPGFVQDLLDVGYELTEQEIIEAKIHGLQPSTIKVLNSKGYHNIPFHKLIELEIHNVNSDSIDTLADLGYQDISLNQLINFAIHGVDKDFIESFVQLGYSPSISELIELEIHLVDTSEISELIDAGYRPTLSELTSMAIHGVDIFLLQKLTERKGHRVDISEAINFAIMGDW
jgi:hypothetical protein